MKIFRFILPLLLVCSFEGMFAAASPSADAPQVDPAAAPGVTQEQFAAVLAQLNAMKAQQQGGSFLNAFGTPGAQVMSQVSKASGVWEIATIFASFFTVQVIDTAKPTFTGIKEFVHDTFFWWKPVAAHKVTARIKTHKAATEKMLEQFLDSDYLKKLLEGETKAEVESMRELAANAESADGKPLEKLLATRAPNMNFDLVRKMVISQLRLVVYQLDTFVMKNAPKEERNFVDVIIKQIRENLDAVVTILEQKFDFKGFTDKDTKVELSMLKMSISQLFNQLLGVFGGEVKDESERKPSYWN